MRWSRGEWNIIFLILFMFLFINQHILPQDIQKESVNFLLDSWKYNLGWRTLDFGAQNYLSVYTQEEAMEKYAKNTVYIEFLGQGVLGSINYDYRFHPNFSFRIGVGYALFLYSFPAMINFLIGTETPHHLELGAGFVLMSYKDLSGIVPTANLGYKFQPKNGGFFFKIAWTPFIHSEAEELIKWGGISIGYTFK